MVNLMNFHMMILLKCLMDEFMTKEKAKLRDLKLKFTSLQDSYEELKTSHENLKETHE